MRKYLALMVLLCCFINSYSQQIIKVENTKYFDVNHNLFTGVYEEIYENGNKKLEMHLLNGEQDSITKLWFENGTINEIRSYKHGLKNGKWETYHINGVKTAEAWYRADKKNGIWKIWDEKGTLRFEMPYSNGDKIGVWRIFDENGKAISERSYREETK